MKTFSLLITTSPDDSARTLAALSFCREQIALGHRIDHIFFYSQGVNHANGLIVSANDELNANHAWQALYAEHAIPLLVCVTAAQKRAVIDEQAANEADLAHHSLFMPFQQVGLGEFFTQLHQCDALVQF